MFVTAARITTQAAALIAAAVFLFSFDCARAELINETEREFITAADVNGDARLDVIVLDRATGNLRVGYQNASGALVWSSPMPTGIASVSGFATGRFLASDREAIAVTAPYLNRVLVVDLTDPSVAASPYSFSPDAAGTSMLIGLRAPEGTTGSRDPLWTSGNSHDPGITLVQAFNFSLDGASPYLQSVSFNGILDSGNSMQFGGSIRTYAATMARESNATFVAFAFTNGIAPFLQRPGLAPRTLYSFGQFNQAFPRFLFYVPGESNILVQALTAVSGEVQFGPITSNAFSTSVERVFYIDEGTNGLVVIHFGDGVAGVRLPAGSGVLQEEFRLGAGATGNVATGVVPLGNGRMALLSRGSNGVASEIVQVFTKSGGSYNLSSSNNLPRVTTTGTRANVWLFANEPFVNANPVFVSSLNGGDWIASISGLPGGVNVVSETDRGTSLGLGNADTVTLSTPPNTVQFGIANQYHPGISLFSYSSVRAPEPVLVTISPPPGRYQTNIAVSLRSSNATDLIHYRVGSSGLYQQYAAPFALSNDATVSYYGTASSGQKSTVQSASYTFLGNSPPPLVTTNGTGTNNIPPDGTINTSSVPSYAYGTIVYSRISGSNGAVWMVNVDGSSDRYVTVGSRPRLSPDGRYLAFLREGDPYATIPYDNGNIWIRDLLAGNERRLVTRTNLISWFDWGYETNLFYDHGCGMFVTDLAGNVRQVSAANHCNDDAPVVNPIDGSLAFHNVSGVLDTNSGLFTSDAALATKTLVEDAPVPHWPSWSPDGQRLAFSSYAYTYIPEGGMDLFIVGLHGDHSHGHQITAFPSGSGFRNGAAWSPAGDALIGAGTIAGTNGIWVLPLSADGTHCEGDPWLIPTTPGSDFGIDFVGSVFVPPGPPRVSIRREGAFAVVFWRRTAWPYVLEATTALGPTATWTRINPPYGVADGRHEVAVPLPGPESALYFRLRLP